MKDIESRKGTTKRTATGTRAKSRGRKGRKARERRLRRRVAIGVAAIAVLTAVSAFKAAPSLSALALGLAAALLVLEAVLLSLRRGMSRALYGALGGLCILLLLLSPMGRNYVFSEGGYVPREVLAEQLKVTDHYPAYLSRMSQVRVVDMRGSTVTDFQPLAALSTLQTIDARGNFAFTQADYDALQTALPDCRILWSMPVGDGHVDSDTENIDLTDQALSAGEIETLLEEHPDKEFSYEVTLMGRQYPVDTTALDLTDAESIDVDAIDEALTLLTAVREIDLRGIPATPLQIGALEDAHPEVHFLFSCAVPSGSMTTEDETVVIPGGDLETLQAYMSFIDYMPNLTTMDATAVSLTDEDVQVIQADPNCAKLLYSFTAFGRTLSTQDTELNLDKVPMQDVDEVERVVSCLPNLQRVSMCDTGLSYKQMAGLCDRHPQVRFIWWVRFGKYKLRTDATAFTTGLYAVNNYHYTSATFAPLQYCKDLMMLDLGHCDITSIAGIAGLTKLRVLILADNDIKDISPLAGLNDLEYVELFMNKITDLTPLANKAKLLDLNLYYNSGIRDISPLATCTALQRVWMGNCGVPKGQISKLKKVLPKCKVYTADGGSTDGGWRNHKRYKVIKKMYKTGKYIPFS